MKSALASFPFCCKPKVHILSQSHRSLSWAQGDRELILHGNHAEHGASRNLVPGSHSGFGKVFEAGKLTLGFVAVGGQNFAQIWHFGRVSHTTIQPGGEASRSASSKVAQGAVAFEYDGDGKPGFLPACEPKPLNESRGAQIQGSKSDRAAEGVVTGVAYPAEGGSSAGRRKADDAF